MFKILILQSLYSLSDDAKELQINDRLGFKWFLVLKPYGSSVNSDISEQSWQVGSLFAEIPW